MGKKKKIVQVGTPMTGDQKLRYLEVYRFKTTKNIFGDHNLTIRNDLDNDRTLVNLPNVPKP